MIFLNGTGTRVSEALNVRLKDLELTTNDPSVRIMGKGNKPRCVPLLDMTVENLDYYLSLYHPPRLPDDYLFYTLIKGAKDCMSVANAERFKKYMEKLPVRSAPRLQKLYIHIYLDTVMVPICTERDSHCQ